MNIGCVISPFFQEDSLQPLLTEVTSIGMINIYIYIFIYHNRFVSSFLCQIQIHSVYDSRHPADMTGDFCAMEMKLREMRRPLAAHFLHSEVHRNGLHKEPWNICRVPAVSTPRKTSAKYRLYKSS